MYPLGHFALGYLINKIAYRGNKIEAKMSLIWLFSILPDIDLLLNLRHRGPTHSLAFMIIIAIPIFIWHRKGVPYILSLASHSLIGDFITSYGIQLFWPFQNKFYKTSYTLKIGSVNEILLEFILFGLMVIILYNSKELSREKNL